MRRIYCIALCFFMVFSGCGRSKTQGQESKYNRALIYRDRVILSIDSYHAGYSWSDGITRGVQETLKDTGIDLRIHRMDTKRNTSEEFRRQAAIRAKTLIEKIKPDIVLVSDDNAFNYLVREYYKDAELPIVYCGLNWDSSVYGAPYKNTTGMIEISMAEQVIKILQEYASGNRVGFISGDTTAERKNMEYYKQKLQLHLDKEYWPTNLAEFKRDFLMLQEEVDIIILQNVIGLAGWNEEQAAELKVFIEENIKIPVGGLYDGTRDYCLIQIEESSFEQGEYMALTALRILDGKKPAEIPEVSNTKGDLALNLRLADRLNIVFSPLLLRNAVIVVGE